jgi:hypothetical protein
MRRDPDRDQLLTLDFGTMQAGSMTCLAGEPASPAQQTRRRAHASSPITRLARP